MAALIALFIAVFVLIPTVDAAACAVEPDSAHATLALDAEPNDDPGKPGDHAICSHGHCHHGGPTLPTAVQLGTMNAALAPSPLRPLSEPLASRASVGLERPPRA